ncbi:hypothetical protein HK099_002454 [Clydaea vesicula]|uniref:Cytosol aminopeptidase domain-containing protein n=1 Tax=Clydaea vesicula TaxID=447962 RepID=A0AAD5U467_9FUNG|nr:hypothetical protein HK099_002454 [Clydaea vesicula]
MALMKGDMGGAAVVLATMSALEKLDLPINVVASIPLTENMPSGSATKPGDVVTAMNGKTIEIDNTDAEAFVGRLILADAIYYTCITHKPKFLIEFSTLTGAMQVALGNVFAGVFTNSAELYQLLEKSGKESGDEFWKMPLDLKYLKAIKSNVADLKNVGDGNGAGSSTAAIFLSEFVPEKDGVEGVDKLSNKITEFAHVDIAGVMHNKGTVGYLGSGMTGRPTRSILELLCNLKQ